jgi:hypothetical protein
MRFGLSYPDTMTPPPAGKSKPRALNLKGNRKLYTIADNLMMIVHDRRGLEHVLSQNYHGARVSTQSMTTIYSSCGLSIVLYIYIFPHP